MTNILSRTEYNVIFHIQVGNLYISDMNKHVSKKDIKIQVGIQNVTSLTITSLT